MGRGAEYCGSGTALSAFRSPVRLDGRFLDGSLRGSDPGRLCGTSVGAGARCRQSPRRVSLVNRRRDILKPARDTTPRRSLLTTRVGGVRARLAALAARGLARDSALALSRSNNNNSARSLSQSASEHAVGVTFRTPNSRPRDPRRRAARDPRRRPVVVPTRPVWRDASRVARDAVPLRAVRSVLPRSA